ncbi:MAG: hypothetical protein Q8858_13225 [Bacteroidota bacterium]|nr:hypothetical protein [Bacteroidota bacterium]
MMKKLFFILALPALLFAQEHNNQNQPQNQPKVELPEFVITGVRPVSLPTVSKQKAEVVSTLSREFFLPGFSPEELSIAELSNPVRKEITFSTDTSKYNGRLIFGAGAYTLPMGELSYGKSFDNGVFNGKLWGSNVRSYYKDNSGYNNSGLDLNGSFFNSYNSGFLPGTKFNVGGGYERDSYKFFASSKTPDLQRDRNKGNIRVGLTNDLKENLKYGLSFNDGILYIKDADVKENVFNAKGYFETGLTGMTLSINAGLKSQNLSNIVSQTFNFFENSASLKFKPSDNLHFSAGFYYAVSGDNTSFFPTGTITLKFSDNLTLLGEMSPYSELVTVQDLIYQNQYLDLNPIEYPKIFRMAQQLDPPFALQKDAALLGQGAVSSGKNASGVNSTTSSETGYPTIPVTNVLVDNKYNLKGALKYEFSKFFEIDGGFRFIDYNNYPCFVPGDSSNGKFNVRAVSAKRFTGFMNFLFHPGPYGIFYGNVQVEHFYDADNQNIPYIPGLSSEISYEYNFDFGLKTETHLNLRTGTWADLPNHTKIDPYINLGVRLGFEVAPNFNLFTQLSNILNRNNYIWYGYKEKSTDVVFGIDYRF